MIYRIFRGRPQNVPLIKAGCDMKRWTWNWDTWQPLCERHVVAKTKLDAQIISISLCVFRQLRASRMAVIWNCKMATHHSLSDERRNCVKCLLFSFLIISPYWFRRKMNETRYPARQSWLWYDFWNFARKLHRIDSISQSTLTARNRSKRRL
jgi:hypothetical protein